ncbi:rhodanese-like domain-containing protein [Candidatus Woesearchaeota archaeon]|nr:rhodanese-like domain-containing protein [Candidatus Woesearchaeota archaeon]
MPLSAIKKIEAHFEGKLLAEIDPYALHQKMQRGDTDFLVLDVRPREMFDARHIKGATSIPLDDLQKAELPHGKLIIVYCGGMTCMLSSKAALLLAKRGFHAKTLIGGLAVWQQDKYPVQRKKR